MSDPMTPSPGEEFLMRAGSQPFASMNPSGSYGTSPTLWMNASTANAATLLAQKETTDKDIKIKELDLSELSIKQAHERSMKELGITEGVVNHENRNESILIWLAFVVVIGGILIETFSEKEIGVPLIIAGAFSILSYFAGKKSFIAK